MLARAVIHTGLPPGRLLLRVLGEERAHQSMFLPTNLRQLAQAVRLDVETLLWRHTVFPFVVAYMEPEAVHQLKQRALSPAEMPPVSFGSLVRSVTASTPGLRYCRQCAQEDLHALGESYWRRTHCLPAVHICLRHQSPLFVASPRPRTLAQHLLAPLPHRQQADEAGTACPRSFMLPLTQAVQETLASRWSHRDDWMRHHRAGALDRQYQLQGDYVAGTQLAADLRHAFGDRYLAELGCDYRSLAQAWPALMTRERPGVTFAPVKHVLLDTFLKAERPEKVVFVYEQPGKKPTDLAELDTRLASMVMQEAARLLALEQTTTVAGLLQATGYWQTFRHQRKLLPLTAAQVAAFRGTNSSERKAGGRQPHAKRLKAIEEGRQKPMKPWSARTKRREASAVPDASEAANGNA